MSLGLLHALHFSFFVDLLVFFAVIALLPGIHLEKLSVAGKAFDFGKEGNGEHCQSPQATFPSPHVHLPDYECHEEGEDAVGDANHSGNVPFFRDGESLLILKTVFPQFFNVS